MRKAEHSGSIVHISAEKSMGGYFQELRNHWQFLYFLTWKELKVRYRSILLGILWATLQPLIYVLALVFVSGVAGMGDSKELPFPLFIFCGLIFWQLFTSIVNGSVQMLLSNASIMRKVYFPKFLLPLSAALVSLVELIPATILLVGLSIYFGVGLSFMTLPILVMGIVITLVGGVGVSGILSLGVLRFPSVRHAIPIILHVLLFVSPILYGLNSGIMEGPLKWVAMAIPISGPIDALRQTLTGDISFEMLGISAVISIVFLITGFLNFFYNEDKVIDHA
ncbi:MAG: lipopolysaccharide transport system permease protein [Bacteroidia bacterium]|jgi:lipopolysaccharide transport system permease protein